MIAIYIYIDIEAPTDQIAFSEIYVTFARQP
jgi:hypothetical protein